MSYPMYHRDFAKEFVPKLQIVVIKAIEMHFNETKNISIEIGKLKQSLLILVSQFKLKIDKIECSRVSFQHFRFKNSDREE